MQPRVKSGGSSKRTCGFESHSRRKKGEAKMKIDLVKYLPEKTKEGREIVRENNAEKLICYTQHPGRRKGRGSKKVIFVFYPEFETIFAISGAEGD